jgi:hypothetical protein
VSGGSTAAIFLPATSCADRLANLFLGLNSPLAGRGRRGLVLVEAFSRRFPWRLANPDGGPDLPEAEEGPHGRK